MSHDQGLSQIRYSHARVKKLLPSQNANSFNLSTSLVRGKHIHTFLSPTTMRTPLLILVLFVATTCAEGRSKRYKYTDDDIDIPVVELLLSDRPRREKWGILGRKIRAQFPKDVKSFFEMLRNGYPVLITEGSKGFPTFRKQLYRGLKYTHPKLLRDAINLKEQLEDTYISFIKPAVRDLGWQLLRLDLGEMLGSPRMMIVPNLSLMARRAWGAAQMVAASAGFAYGEIYGLVIIILLLMLWRPSLLDYLLSGLLGPLMMAFGAAIVVRAFSDLGFDNFSIYPGPTEDGYLVTDGVYSVVRHPMYAGLIVTVFGVALSSKSMARLALTGAVIAVVLAVMEVEEDLLARTFPMYRFYADRVEGRLIPGLY